MPIEIKVPNSRGTVRSSSTLLGVRLRYKRELDGMGLSEAAAASGVSRSALAYAERGDRRSTDPTMGKLSQYLNISPVRVYALWATRVQTAIQHDLARPSVVTMHYGSGGSDFLLPDIEAAARRIMKMGHPSVVGLSVKAATELVADLLADQGIRRELLQSSLDGFPCLAEERAEANVEIESLLAQFKGSLKPGGSADHPPMPLFPLSC